MDMEYAQGAHEQGQKARPKAYFTHKSIYAYLPLFVGSWNMQECWHILILGCSWEYWDVHELLEYENIGMRILGCSWALGICKNIGTRTYFGSITVESVRGFRHFAFWRYGFKLATFFIVHMNCIFWGASFKPIQNLATLNPENIQYFHGTPLSHSYTLVYILHVYCPPILT